MSLTYVPSLPHGRPYVTVHFQTELAIITNGAVSDVHRDVLTTQTVVSDVRHNVTNTHTIVSDTHVVVSDLQHNVTKTQTMVSDIHRTIVESQEGTGGKTLLVSVTVLYSSPNQHSSLHRLKIGW